MRGVVDVGAVLDLLELSRELIRLSPKEISVVLIDTTEVTDCVGTPTFVRACKELVSYYKQHHVGALFGVSANMGIRAIASTVGFATGVKMRLHHSLDAAIEAAHEHIDFTIRTAVQ